MPSRRGYIMPVLCENKNLEQGYKNSKHGKTYVYNMLKHKEFNPIEVLNKLQQDFLQGTYKTSNYTTFKVYEPKERLIFRLPYAPDRIAHHCIMNVMEEFWTNKLPNTSYSCVKGRGILGVWKYMKKCLKDKKNTKYCLKCDIKKFFPNVNHQVLFNVLCRYIKDKEFLALLEEIINSTDKYVIQTGNGRLGYNLPIGNYLSQYFANLIMGLVFIELRKKFPKLKIIIYMDDIVVLASNKESLHLFKIYLHKTLQKFDLTLKDNYQIFPVDKQSISFVGFIFNHEKIRLRKKIVKSIYNLCYKYRNHKITKSKFKQLMASYYGWIKYSDSKGICKKVYKLTHVWYSNWKGILTKITHIYNEPIDIYHITKHSKFFSIEAIYKKRPIEVYSANKSLIRNLFCLHKYNKWNKIILVRCL